MYVTMYKRLMELREELENEDIINPKHNSGANGEEDVTEFERQKRLAMVQLEAGDQKKKGAKDKKLKKSIDQEKLECAGRALREMHSVTPASKPPARTAGVHARDVSDADGDGGPPSDYDEDTDDEDGGPTKGSAEYERRQREFQGYDRRDGRGRGAGRGRGGGRGAVTIPRSTIRRRVGDQMGDFIEIYEKKADLESLKHDFEKRKYEEEKELRIKEREAELEEKKALIEEKKAQTAMFMALINRMNNNAAG